MRFEEYIRERLWPILLETAHALVMYPHHKAYAREIVLNEAPNTTPDELAARLKIPLGEALVILYELKGEKSGLP